MEQLKAADGLIETWDVLKFEIHIGFCTDCGLIETWDVLKLVAHLIGYTDKLD